MLYCEISVLKLQVLTGATLKACFQPKGKNQITLKGGDFMQIRTTMLGEHIAKLLATKPTVEIYEVEEWWFCSTNICARDSYITYFTTLEEAKHHFDNVAELNKLSREHNNIMKAVGDILSYRKEGCTLRKITASLEGCRSEVIAINTSMQLFQQL